MNLYLFTSFLTFFLGGSRGVAPGRFVVVRGQIVTDNSKRTGPAIESHYQFLAWLAPTVGKFPKSHKFTIGDRIETIALDVLEALIEATYTRERTQNLREANLGIEKLRFLLRLAADLKLLNRGRYEHAARSLDETGRLIGGWMKAQSTPNSPIAGNKNASTA